MESVDRVRHRPGGRNAEVRERVFTALRTALESGDPDALAIDSLARASGVHRTTIYRRWLSTSGAIADLLTELTPLRTPLPDGGDIRDNLVAVATRVARTIQSPQTHALLTHIAGSRDPVLAEAARRYWGNLFDHTADVVRAAQADGRADRAIEPRAAIELLLAPLYLRLLVTHQPLDTETIQTAADLTMRAIATAGHRGRSTSHDEAVSG